jgi:ATP-dependent 26S proteasome regulatory subunit
LAAGGAIDEALLRPGRCFGSVVVHRLSIQEGRKLTERLCGGDAEVAERIVMQTTQVDTRNVSTASIYRAWQAERDHASMQRPPIATLRAAGFAG